MSVETLDKIAEQVKDLIGDDYQEAVTEMSQNVDDFTVGKYRFIHEDAIDDILADELSSDVDIMGYFNASFISSVTQWPIVLIEAAQRANQFAAIGEAIINGHFLQEMAEQYARADGYGHHFAHYDGHEHNIGNYYAFRIN